MTFAYWSVLLTAFLPLVWAGVAKTGGTGYDNARPRLYLKSLNGYRQRAHWAQENSYEAFPPFAAGVIIAHVAGGSQLAIDVLAGIFLLARILHGIFYITDRSTLRSLIWVVGFGCIVGLFVSAA